MNDEITFKFNPLHVLFLSICPVLSIYLFIDGFYSDVNVFLFIMAGGSSWMVLPKLFKMLFGIPAIRLSGDKLINNVSGLNISWEDINSVRIRDTGRITFLVIGLINPEEYFEDTGIRRIFNYFISISDNEILINISFVKGSDSEILDAIQNYRVHIRKEQA